VTDVDRPDLGRRSGFLNLDQLILLGPFCMKIRAGETKMPTFFPNPRRLYSNLNYAKMAMFKQLFQ